MQDAGNQIDHHQPVREARPGAGVCQSIDWYAEGESRIVEVDGVCVEVRFTGRKGRRSRIAITAPPGSTFRSSPSG